MRGRQRVAARALAGGLATASAVAAVAVTAAAASAATILGSPLSLSFEGGVGQKDHTFVQTHLTEPSAQLTSPVNGTVVRWSLRGTSTNTEENRFELRVLAPAAEGKFVGVATSLQVTTPSASNDDVTRSFATGLPIRAGDAVGIYAIEFATVPKAISPGATFEEFEPFADGSLSGAPETFGPPTSEETELLFNAEVVAAPTATAAVPSCSETGAVNVSLTTDPATSPKAVDFRIDGGATQSAAATGGAATIAVPGGHHTLEYWGEDAIPQQEIAHHVATLQVGGCALTPILPAPILPAKPEITRVSQSSTRWREGPSEPVISRRRRHPIRAPVGTTFSFTLNESARVTFEFTQTANGSKVKGRCVTRTRKNRRAGACKRTTTAGTLGFLGHAGLNKVAFAGRLPGGKKLKPGSYILVIAATDPLGRAATPQKLAFTILK